MPAIRISQASRGVIVLRKKDGGVRAVHRILVEELVHRLQEEFSLFAGEGKLAAQVCLKIRHQQRGGNPLAGDIADQQSEPPLSQRKEIIVIAADMTSLNADASVVERLQGRKRLREEPRLHLFR